MDRALLIVNGPRVDASTDAILDACTELAHENGFVLECRRTDDDETFHDWLEDDAGRFSGLVVNPGVIPPEPDMLHAVREIVDRGIPVVEVHLENIFRSDEGGAPVLPASSQTGFVCGLGLRGYEVAIAAIASRLAAMRH